ncbi:uncharacterized protein [Eucyclogobius newberryi]|uniref:uncharacterized protein isoform X1 n=1 Tax=Eucyclogobius newberryi TaxID=166745 RepID=UPI003B59A5C3
MNELTPDTAASERREPTCRRSANMSKAQALRDLVMERLVVAADEIFALFERTFAEYEEELVRTKHLQPRMEPHKEDAPPLILHPEVHHSPEHVEDEQQTVLVKQEEDHSFEFSAAYSVKSEENMGILLPEEEPSDPTEEQCAVEEEPGCSLTLQTDNNEEKYDTDDSEDWRPSDTKKSPKSAGLKKDSKRGVQTFRKSPEAAFLHHRPNENSRHEPFGDEKPGCSSDLINLQPNYGSYSYSDTSEAGNPAKELTETTERQEFNLRLANDSKTCRTNQNTSLFMSYGENNDVEGLEISSKAVVSVNLCDRNEQSHYACSECGVAFQTLDFLQNHLVLHSSQSPFRCPTCHKLFRYKSSYKTHLSVHTDDKPLSCSFCNKGFRQKYNLKEHMRIHTDEKPFRCPDCGVRVRHHHNLIRHVLTVHKGQKPYSCPVCEKAFSQKSHYNIHVRTHTGEKPFSCPVCQKSFRAKYCLKRHIATHSDPAGDQAR